MCLESPVTTQQAVFSSWALSMVPFRTLVSHMMLMTSQVNNNILFVYFSDMQKFPLRMKDNDLLVTELFRDPTGDSVTALSVYMTPKISTFAL